MEPIDWIYDLDSDNDEESAYGFNEDFESDCWGDDAAESS
jgi:hypothetical protein